MNNNIKLVIFLLTISALSGLFLSLTDLATKDKIKAQKILEIQKALKEVLPTAVVFQELTREADGSIIYSAQKDAKPIGRAIICPVTGYGGPIWVLTGIDLAEKVTKVVIISHNETPGLGSKAQDSTFLNQFSGKSSKDELAPKKDILAVTGATITSRAVCNGVKRAFSN
jgi:electron transport complex protein RnfG